MKEKDICVKIIDDGWGVVLRASGGEQSKDEDIIIRMNSKESAVRYARICEQRTGNKVLFAE